MFQQPSPAEQFRYNDAIEQALEEIERLLGKTYRLSKRAISLLLLQEDEEITRLVQTREGVNYPGIRDIVERTRARFDQPLNYVITLERQNASNKLISQTVAAPSGADVPSPDVSMRPRASLAERLSRITMHPVLGIPFLLLVLYYGLYQFVGVFGAGTVVDFLEDSIFGKYLNPAVNTLVDTYIPWPAIQELLAHEYGVITLGLRYAIAIILPIVGTFFLAFSVIEDTGYLPRLAMLVDGVFKRIGLNGRAVIPITLGFGCDTMATMVTRTLETRRERVIATLLLALAIPCSAQLGVILALLSGKPAALLVWAGFVALIFLLIGYLTAKLMPGEQPSFYMEVPPLRLPRLSNVLAKTYTRMQWYFVEILPLFILASLLIWAGRQTGLFDLVINVLKPAVRWIGLPDEAAMTFLFGFFRRDYGAAGLYDLQQAGLLTGTQLVVASATLTLFVPCIAQFSIMVKERGAKTAVAIAAFIFPFAFAAGYALNLVLTSLGVQL